MTFVDRFVVSLFFVQVFTKVTYDEQATATKWLVAAIIATVWHWLSEWLS